MVKILFVKENFLRIPWKLAQYIQDSSATKYAKEG